MKISRMDAIVRDLGTLFCAGTFGGFSDGQLLGRFVERREPDAFEAIIHRHGPMVWGVCCRVLRDRHDAEDAFQATFLVLARRAASVNPQEKLGNWLYGVAYQTARKARMMRDKRRIREGQVSGLPEPTACLVERRDDLTETLDRELNRLPEKYRITVVLCDLEGMTHREAASRLGLPIGTISSRLNRARTMLAKRLSRPGVLFTVGTLPMLLGKETALSMVPARLVGPTARAASLVAARRAIVTGVVSAKVASLTRKVMRTMNPLNGNLITGFILSASLMAAGDFGSLAPGQESASAPHRRNIQETGKEQLASQLTRPRIDPFSASQKSATGGAGPDGQAAAPPAKQHRIEVITSITNTSSIPVGRRCRVTLTPETNGRSQIVEIVHEGKVSKATAEGITLAETSALRTEKSPSALAKLPFVKRLFTNHGITKAKPGEETVIWIPAEKIRSIALAQDDTP